MTKTIRTAALLLLMVLLLSPAMFGTAAAHDMGKGDHAAWHHHGHFTEAQRKLLHDTMQRVHEQNKPLFEDIRKQHEALHKVMSAPKFDKAAFVSITSDIGQKRVQMMDNRMQAFAGIADQFLPEQRKFLLRKLAMMHHGEHGHHHHGGDHHEYGGQGGWEHHEMHEGTWHHDEGGQWSTPAEGAGGGSDATIQHYDRSGSYPPYPPQ